MFLPGPGVEPKDQSVVPYFDLVRFWLRAPVSPATIAWLRKHCGHVHQKTRKACFDKKFRQRIELKQPKPEALKWLAGQSAMINRVEVALDYAFPTAAHQEAAYSFLHRHLVRRWHRRRQRIHIEHGKKGTQTRYDGPRYAANGVVFYPQPRSRITGASDIVHLEWRLNRLMAVRAAGIRSGRDLLNFDHRAFWQKRLLLFDVKAGRLGRLRRNSVTRKRSRAEHPNDARIGQIMINCVEQESRDWTVQELIDLFRSSYRMERALQPIDIEHWLPGSSTTPVIYGAYSRTQSGATQSPKSRAGRITA
jgi:hypothetical protein